MPTRSGLVMLGDLWMSRRCLSTQDRVEMLACEGVPELAWRAPIPRGWPVLMIAEGLVPYRIKADARRLLTRIVDAFPIGELEFDTGSARGSRSRRGFSVSAVQNLMLDAAGVRGSRVVAGGRARRNCHAGPVNTCGLPLVPDGALLVANGKQALSLVAQDLRDRGVRTLLAPDFYCLTMIQPFQLEGITVRHVATDARGLLDSEALAEELATGQRSAVLHCEVFGGLAGTGLRDVLEEAQAQGVPVVVDVTHSLFATSHGPADYLVASLRKLLPVPDGAFATGLAGRPAVARHSVDAMATAWGLIAARRRGALLTGRGSAADYLDAVDLAEEAMHDAREPASMSRAALRRLSRVDPDMLRQARQVNATYLIDCLTSSGVEVVNATTPECGVVVHVEDAPSVERDLVIAGILCPISWPRPPGLRRDTPWPTGWVTLPVDPDLAPPTLHRAACIVTQVDSTLRSW